MFENLKIAVLITCHNRKEKTLLCLEHLFLQKGMGENFQIDVFLVDDGSTDGTSQAVLENFPSVNIIKGSGDLFWNQGMRLAWDSAADRSRSDFYLWLNDDTFLFENAILHMLECAKLSNEKSIICGITCSANKNEITYGGFDKSHKIILPNGLLNDCSIMNGNIVLVPETVFEILGNLSNSYRHALGDFDYCIRAKKKNIKVLTSKIVVAFCQANENTLQCYNFDIPLIKRLKIFYSPVGLNPFEFYKFDKLENGFFIAAFHFVTNHFKLILKK